MNVCSIDGCEKVAKCKGLCSTHYNRWWRHGDPNKVLRRRDRTEDEKKQLRREGYHDWKQNLDGERLGRHKDSRRESQRKWRKNNLGYFRQKKKRTYVRRTEKAMELFGGECLVCGLRDHSCVYDFHHKDESQKDFTISTQLINYKWSRIEVELRKCVLLCAPCHRKYHAGVLDDSAQTRIETFDRYVESEKTCDS